MGSLPFILVCMVTKVKKVATVTTVTKVKEENHATLQEITLVYTIHALDFDLSCIE